MCENPHRKFYIWCIYVLYLSKLTLILKCFCVIYLELRHIIFYNDVSTQKEIFRIQKTKIITKNIVIPLMGIWFYVIDWKYHNQNFEYNGYEHNFHTLYSKSQISIYLINQYPF